MAAVVRILVLVAPVVLLVVVSGPFFGFDVPKLLLASLLAAVGTPVAVTALRSEWSGYSKAARVLITAAGAFVVTTAAAALQSGVWPLAVLGQSGRFVGAATLIAATLLIVVVPAGLRTPADVDRLLQVLAATVALFCGYIVVQWIGLDPGPWATTWGRQPVGTVGNPNFVGAIAALGAPLAIGLVFHQRGRRVRMAGAALAALTVFALWAASSRLGFAAAVAGGSVVAALAPGAGDRTVVWQRAGVAVLPLGGVVAGHATIGLGVLLDDRNAVARWWFWRSGVRMWQEAPVLGVGPGRFGAYDPATRAPERIAAIQHDILADSSHAYLVDLLATVGLLGLVPVLVLLVAAGLVLHGQHLVAEDRTDRVRVAVIAGLLTAHGVQAGTSVPTVGSVWIGGLLLGAVLVPLSRPWLRARDDALRRWRRQQGGRGNGRGESTQETGLPTMLVTVALLLVVAVPGVRVLSSTYALAESEALLHAGRADLARSVSIEASQRTPWWPFAWQQLAQVEIQRNDADGVARAVDEGVRRDRRDLPLTRLLANLNRDLGNEGAAEEAYRRVVELDPYGLGTNTEVARWALEAGRTDLAREAVDRLDRAVTEDMRQSQQVRTLREELAGVSP